MNHRPGQSFRSLTFTKLISDAAGVPIKLVILRRKTAENDDVDDAVVIDYDDDDDDERDEMFRDVDDRLDLRLVRSSNVDPTATIERQSTGSSGISSSELVDSPSSLDGESHILRL